MVENKSTILIVDDEPSCREALRMALEDDYVLLEAESGEEALRILQKGQDIDLVLLDYLLPPGMDGLEVLARMRACGYKTPVILVTGRGSEQVAVKALRLGVRNYIMKPFKVHELQTIVKETLAPIQLEESLVDRAVDFIEREYCRPISARDVAQGIGVSYPHLARLFKAEKGCPVEAWLNKLRVEKARLLLKNTDLPVKEISKKIGFNHSNYFSRLFKEVVGIYPTEYRTQSRCHEFPSK